MPAPTQPLGVFTMRATDRRDPAIDFAKDLVAPETIASVTAALWRLDTAPPTAVGAPVLDGSPTPSGTQVKQMLKQPAAGITHQLDITITTSAERVVTESILIVVGLP